MEFIQRAKLDGTDTWTFQYDHRNQLLATDHKPTTASTTVDKQVVYKYDVFANRIEKSSDPDGPGGTAATITRFAHTGTNVWADLDGSSSLTTRRLHGDSIDSVWTRITPGAPATVSWYLADRLGSIRHQTDNQGTLTNTLTYDAFGKVASESNPSTGDRIKAFGREFEIEFSAYHNRARIYDPQTGRFWQEDPIWPDDGANPFHYTRNSPTNATDPMGLQQRYSPEGAGTSHYPSRLLAADREAALDFQQWLAGKPGSLSLTVGAHQGPPINVSLVPSSQEGAAYQLVVNSEEDYRRVATAIAQARQQGNHWKAEVLSSLIFQGDQFNLLQWQQSATGNRYDLQGRRTEFIRSHWDDPNVAARRTQQQHVTANQGIWNHVQRLDPKVAEWFNQLHQGLLRQDSGIAVGGEGYYQSSGGTLGAGRPEIVLPYGLSDEEAAAAIIQQVTEGPFKYDYLTWSTGRLHSKPPTQLEQTLSDVGNFLKDNLPGETFEHLDNAHLALGRGDIGGFFGEMSGVFLRTTNPSAYNTARQFRDDLDRFIKDWGRGDDLAARESAGRLTDSFLNFFDTILDQGLQVADPCANPATVRNMLQVRDVVGALRSAGQAGNAIQAGDWQRGVAGIWDLANRLFRLFNPCFVAGTPVMTPAGAKPIEELAEGEQVLARAEWAEHGIVAGRRVERVFVRWGRVLHVHVGGQAIGTTANHPFWVRGRGWTAAGALQPGDRLSSHDGQWIAVEEVYDTGEYTKVYNLQVAEWHTYFVGDEEWGFSVWTHNTCAPKSAPGIGELSRDNVANFMRRNNERLNDKLGQKLGQKRPPNEALPFAPGKEGVARARGAVAETLSKATEVSKPSTTSGGQITVDVYSAETGFTVRLRPDGSFVTLIPGKTNRFAIP